MANDHDDPTLNRLLQWAMPQTAIRAMLLTSTRAVPHASVDELSDYDVILVVQDIQPFFQDRTWLQHFGEVLVTYWDRIHPDPHYGINQFANVIQYASGLKIDFTLWPIELFQRIVEDPVVLDELDAGYKVLLDKDGLTAGLAPPTYTAYIPKPPSNEQYQTFVEEFLSDAPYVAKCLWRDELLPAKWALDYDMKHVYLRQMLEWRVECEHQWSQPVGSLGKRLKKVVPPELWAQLERSYTGASITELWEALFATLALFQRTASDVATHLGFAYPHELHERVVRYVQTIRARDDHRSPPTPPDALQ